MAKIVLDDVTRADNVQKINENFTKLEQELQNKILYRDNPVGEPNQMENDLDMNSNDLLNVAVANINTLVVGGTNLNQKVLDAANSAAAAKISEDNAKVSEDNAKASEEQAALSALSVGFLTFDSLVGEDGLGGPGSLIDANFLTVGLKVRTLGYYTPGDGGGNDYEIGTGFGTDDGGSIIDLSGSGLQAKGLFVDGVVNSIMFGADKSGVTSSTSQINNARDFCKSIKSKLIVPGGNYIVKLDIDAEIPIVGDGIKNTILNPESEDYVVKVFGVGDNGIGSSISNLSIRTDSGNGVGLIVGSDSGSGFSNGDIENIEIQGFDKNWVFDSAVMCNFSNVYSYEATSSAIEFDSEANVTTCNFNTCRFRLSGEGGIFRAGHILTWTNCNFESNVNVNARLSTGLSSGPTGWSFDRCWFENLTAASGTRDCISLDMNPTIGTTKAMDVKFRECTISSPSGARDVRADRAQNVIFDTCSFSNGAFNNANGKLSFAATNAVKVKLIQCKETLQKRPNPTDYASFIPLSSGTGGPFGFEYTFEFDGEIYSNRPKVFLSSDLSIASGGSVSFNHPLFSVPKSYNLYLKCLVDEDGYVAGDIIGTDLNTTSISSDKINSIKLTSTQVTIRFSNATSAFNVANANTGVMTGITNGNWRLLVSIGR